MKSKCNNCGWIGEPPFGLAFLESPPAMIVDTITDSQRAVLEDYARSVAKVARQQDQDGYRMDVVGRRLTSLATTNPEVYHHNVMKSTLLEIRAGRESWERIAEVAERYRKSEVAGMLGYRH